MMTEIKRVPDEVAGRWMSFIEGVLAVSMCMIGTPGDHLFHVFRLFEHTHRTQVAPLGHPVHCLELDWTSGRHLHVQLLRLLRELKQQQFVV